MEKIQSEEGLSRITTFILFLYFYTLEYLSSRLWTPLIHIYGHVSVMVTEKEVTQEE